MTCIRHTQHSPYPATGTFHSALHTQQHNSCLTHSHQSSGEPTAQYSHTFSP